MTQRLFVLFSAVLLMATEQSALHIRDCSSGVRDVTEDTDASFTCGPYKGRVEWYSSTDKLQWKGIGYCEGNRCSPPKASSFLLNAKVISRWKDESTLVIKNVTRQQDNFLKCGYEGTADVCRLRIVVPFIPRNCNVTISEWRLYGTCAVEKMFGSDGYSCMWSVNNDKLPSYQPLSQYWIGGRRYQTGSCNFSQTMPVDEGVYTYRVTINPGPSNYLVKTITIVPPGDPVHTCNDTVEEGSSVICKCTSSNKGFPPAVFTWDKQNTDILQIQNIQREYNGWKYTCRLTWGPNGLINRTVDFILKVADNYISYFFTIDTTVTQFFYVPISIVPNSCSVQLSGWKVSGVCTDQRVMGGKSRMCKWNMKNKNNKEEFQGVVGYTHMYSDTFVRETCSFLHEMPVDNGNYTYSISVSSHPADQWGKTIYIEKPDVPQHNCSKMILEGSNVTCTCFTPKLGNPPAQVGWEGLGKTYLTIEGKKPDQGIVFKCSLTWGVLNYTTPYVVNISYGPSQTYISSSEESSGDETKTMLMCTAIDVYPSAVFHWNISCDKETHGVNTSTCTLSTSRVEDNTAVECMATNQIFVEMSSTTTYVFKPRRNDITNNHLMVGIIAGSDGALIILTILVAVIVVCVKRRIANKTPTHNVHFTAPSTDVNTISNRRENEYITFDDPTLHHLLYLTPMPIEETVRIPETRTPVVRTSAPSGDLYTIVGPATVGDNEAVTVQEAAENRTRATIRNSGHQARTTDVQTNEGTESASLAIKHKPTRLDKKELHNQSVTDYMNIPQVPRNSRLGVYHHVRRAATSETRISDANVTDGTDEYDVLRVQKSRTGQEDHAATYSRLDFK